jgi:predicted transposase/invertase (TIGR01784 family)
MKTQTDPKVDYAFKHLFGREESKPALKSLLNAVLQPEAGEGIASLELLNPFNEKASESAKLSIVDIKARDESGRQFLIEMQMLAGEAFRQRALYYWAALYQEQLHQGEDWPALRPTIAVCFVDTPLFSEIPDYHSIFELCERRRQTLFTDQLALHILELPKFHKRVDELTTPLDRWLYLLRHGEELDPQAVPVSLDVPEVRWALGDLFMISRTDPDRELYEARLRERRDQAARRQAALEAEQAALAKGLAEGRAEGLAEGRAEGRAEGQADLRRTDIQWLQKSLGREVTPLEQLQALSWDDLERILAQLQADLLNDRK